VLYDTFFWVHVKIQQKLSSSSPFLLLTTELEKLQPGHYYPPSYYSGQKNCNHSFYSGKSKKILNLTTSNSLISHLHLLYQRVLLLPPTISKLSCGLPINRMNEKLAVSIVWRLSNVSIVQFLYFGALSSYAMRWMSWRVLIAQIEGI